MGAGRNKIGHADNELNAGNRTDGLETQLIEFLPKNGVVN